MVTNVLTRRAAIRGAAALGVASALGLAPAHAAGAGPRALIAFDDAALADRAETLVRAKGFAIDRVDLRARGVGVADIGRAAVLIVACRDAGEGRAFARATAVAFGVKFLIYGERGWMHFVRAGSDYEWRESDLDEPRAGLVLDAVIREHLDRPGPMIRA